MATKLVIVESPAKAKTIGGYLGSDYEVLASIGHIRDLLGNAKSLPEPLRKKWWADYAVDVDAGFEPFYEVPREKAAQVSKLRAALKGKDTLVLATDEDREGESISWHLLQVLKPPKGVTVQRIAFHEITKDAILRAMQNPRPLDEKLVEAQETRRILDRLYGYTLSPVLWSRVTKNLSAGRVQSPAVKLVVDREEDRRRFVAAGYWDLKAAFEAEKKPFSAILRAIGDKRLAQGKDFEDTTGQLRPKADVLVLSEADAKALVLILQGAKPYNVTRLEAKEGTERPAAPFMTTTLQQEANRKFGFGADRTMRIAQSLYEGVAIGGETVGLITYMRTDSLNLSNEAVASIRHHIQKEYPDCLPDKPAKYTSKVRNAQEAHEAIRPTDIHRKPSDISRFLNADQLKIYDLIYKRTLASQMKPATVLRTEADVSTTAAGTTYTFFASGKQILFDGFLRIYREDVDDEPEDDDERVLPKLAKGQEVDLKKLGEQGHQTKPPARYTEATLIRKLEEQGIGRPSTYATIISTIQDRGYVRLEKKQLIPTWKAYLTMEVLEKNFQEFMELSFTSKMDEALDDIADGSMDSRKYLQEFFLGSDGRIGLHKAVEGRRKEIPYPAFVLGIHPETQQPILVRNSKDGGAFLQVGEGTDRKFANLPDDLAPADLNLEKAQELLSAKGAAAESVGIDPVTGRRLLLRFRQGYYLEAERTQEEIDRKDKPRWISVPPGIDPRNLTQEDLDFLCNLPRKIGKHPDTGAEVLYKMGKFGAYVESGEERRTLEDWRTGLTMSLDEALAVLATPKAGKVARQAAGPIQEFAAVDGLAGPMRVLAGRYGPYVTDGATNATLPKGKDPATITAEEAEALIRAKMEAGPSAPRGRFKKKTTFRGSGKTAGGSKAKKSGKRKA
ncbi:MAG: type I DNA topoisomerase [Armatimonadetes bacterium]|nr:type I DNA topoisomerase [Armatimonadota bacterium]